MPSVHGYGVLSLPIECLKCIQGKHCGDAVIVMQTLRCIVGYIVGLWVIQGLVTCQLIDESAIVKDSDVLLLQSHL